MVRQLPLAYIRYARARDARFRSIHAPVIDHPDPVNIHPTHYDQHHHGQHSNDNEEETGGGRRHPAGALNFTLPLFFCPGCSTRGDGDIGESDDGSVVGRKRGDGGDNTLLLLTLRRRK